VRLVPYDDAQRPNFQYVVLEVDEREAGLHRDELQRVLQAERVLARRYFHPGCHRMEPYRSYFPHAGLLLPETERLTARVLSLPTGTAVGAEEISTICGIVRGALAQAPAVRRRLAAPAGPA
jgi:dTDP-4-amino-4,6-dideoxygalactose transaminase